VQNVPLHESMRNCRAPERLPQRRRRRASGGPASAEGHLLVYTGGAAFYAPRNRRLASLPPPPPGHVLGRGWRVVNLPAITCQHQPESYVKIPQNKARHPLTMSIPLASSLLFQEQLCFPCTFGFAQMLPRTANPGSHRSNCNKCQKPYEAPYSRYAPQLDQASHSRPS